MVSMLRVCLVLYLTLVVGIFADNATPPPIKKVTAKPTEAPKTTTTSPSPSPTTTPVASNGNETIGNASLSNTTQVNTTVTSTTLATTSTTKAMVAPLPAKGAAEEEHHSSMTIFFVLSVIALCVLIIHVLLKFNFTYLPESIAIVIVGTILGGILKLFSSYGIGNWQSEEAFDPTMFFLILLPPIIFESGYNLHKGNFFQNFGSILVFAVIGTFISAMIIGGGVYLLGLAQVAYKLSLVESFAFGSLISAVDPVATLAIFHALDVDPVLYMLVFGESVLNDAVSIVLTTTVLELASPSASAMSGAEAFFSTVWRFCSMFVASAVIGTAFGLVSAMLLKFVDLRKTPSLEFGLMLVFSYLPYGLAEGLKLSGIMAILFAGIVMSHYTHLNLSPVTQITTQQTFRTVAFMAETCVFAYLGLAISSYSHIVKPSFVIWSIVLCLVGRACNIFPLSFVMNYFREHKITRKNQFIMWFSGLRGAIAFALSLHLEFTSEVRHVLLTTTLIIVLFTLMVLGGATLPLLKLLKAEKRKKTKPGRELNLSKTKEMGDTIDTDHLSELTDMEDEVNYVKPHLKGFMKIDAKYLVPFLTRRLTKEELRDGTNQMKTLTNQWYQEVRAVPSEDEEDEEMQNLTAQEIR
ncbi:sodium/hydrogen exchanger 8 isoform X2 [Lingula anatina]|uniref:Sodium/hydrogen exchanger n=1 Tax=Lingula anatina TaxID=7574 RepID=A0A1S3H5M7_LINAN|nr:sodium/hydrogen exchanger 8 isoform X2 [Lingula anatina]|eukprot:XP_013381445.1 sodium/hydrogen exchanger 8 isoform X2 [Lingula anatina]